MVMLALILGAGTALAARETPVPRRLAISPDMVRVAGDGPGQAAPAPQSEADKAWQNLLDEDFEGVFPGDTWTIYSSASVPYWGTWECWSGNTATHSAACAAAGPGAIGCGGLYPAYMSTWMVAGPFDLSDPDITAAELSCVLNLVSETNVDYLLMSVSTDGQNFSGLQYSFLVMGEAIQLDLTAVPNLGSVVGASQVWVGFYFTSDWSLSYGVGAEVDDVLLRVDRPTPNVPPTITLNSPDGGESWLAGSQHAITWTAADADGGPNALTVDLAYSLNGGGSWVPIAAARPNTGSYNWTLPTQGAANVLVRATVSDGEDTATDTSDGSFAIVVPGSNTLAVGNAAGDSGAQVTVVLSLDNEDTVKGVQADLVFDGTLAALTGIVASQRGVGMSAGAEMVAAGRGRVILYYSDGGSLAPGTGEIAQLTFRLQGPGGSTALTPADVLLAGPEAEDWLAQVQAGNLQVAAPQEVPSLSIAVLKNPGRTRTIQVFVTVTNGSGTAPTVSAGGNALALSAVDAGHVYMGRLHLAGSATSVTVTAQDTNAVGTGNAQVTVQLP